MPSHYQVLTKSQTGKDPDGWFKARVKMIKGGFVVVDYLGWESTYSEIVSTDRVRPQNTNEPLSIHSLHQTVIEVPPDLKEM